ncbi:YtxH domain-containing protein [Staphylococcus pseudintermedius]|nr:YtxH domain-containing protein [Staphylococcus pseudintermedius]
MKIVRMTLGVVAGVATGLGVALVARDGQTRIDNPKAARPKTELELEVDTMKNSIHDIKRYTAQIKNESQSFAGSIGDEVKTMIGEFKADINPNIKQLQSHIENLQNRGEEMTNFPTKK